MATITGSGKWIKITGGTLKFGYRNATDGTDQTYCNIYAVSLAQNSQSYEGIRFAGLKTLAFSNLEELSIGNAKGYTGEIQMCTEFTHPYGIISMTTAEMRNVKIKFTTYKFINGIMVGRA